MVDRQLASKFPRGVSAHPVSDHKEVALALIVLHAVGQRNRQIVLVGGAAHSNIAERSDLKVVVPI